MLQGELLDDSKDGSGRHSLRASDPQFSDRRIGEEFDVLHALSKLIERRETPFDENAAIRRRLNAAWTAFEPECSRSAIALEMAGWDVCRRSAALCMLPASTTAMSTRTSYSLRRRSMPSMSSIGRPVCA